MRAIDELLPDVTVAAAGAPQFVVLHALSRALAEFLTKSEAWLEWAYEVDPADIVDADGVYDWAKHIDPTDGSYDDYQWLRTKRVDTVLWGTDSDPLTFQTTGQLARINRAWRKDTAVTPTYFTQEGSSGGSVRFVAIPNGTDYGDLVVLARLVMITNVSTGQGSGAGAQVPQLPDRLFERFRETLVAGALAILYAMPGRDWTQSSQVAYQRGIFDDGIRDASSQSDADYGHPALVMSYGGY